MLFAADFLFHLYLTLLNNKSFSYLASCILVVSEINEKNAEYVYKQITCTKIPYQNWIALYTWVSKFPPLGRQWNVIVWHERERVGAIPVKCLGWKTFPFLGISDTNRIRVAVIYLFFDQRHWIDYLPHLFIKHA